MFKFNRIVFIITDYIVSFSFFLMIFLLRYSNIGFIGAGSRMINPITMVFFSFYSLVIVIFMIAFRVYEVNRITKITESLPIAFLVSFISMSLFGVIFYISKSDFARFVFFTGFLSVPVIILIYNKLFYMLYSRNKKPVRILYFGSRENYELFTALISDYSRWFLMKLDKVFMNENSSVLKKKVGKNNLLIIDTDQSFKKEHVNFLNEFEITGGKFYTLIDMFQYFDQSLPGQIIKNSHYEKFSSYKLDSFYNRYLKRLTDIILSVFLLVLLSPLIIIFMALIKISSKGKIIYKQKRVTVNSRIFDIYKFRSMKESDKEEINFTEKNDKRLTFIGRFMRPLRIDEIPQLLNVLKGEMSFIGPRPERPEIISKIIKQNPLFKKRLLIKPGITGWAQVKYPYVNSLEKMDKKLSYDLYYINNLSIKLDLTAFLYTLETIIFRRGAV